MEKYPPIPERMMTKKELVELTRKLSERREGFPFSGIEEASLAKLRADDVDCPGYVTPIDDLVPMFEAQGMKVVLGDHPDNGDAWILPMDSTDAVTDSVLPRDLTVTADMDPELKRLILHGKGMIKPLPTGDNNAQSSPPDTVNAMPVAIEHSAEEMGVLKAEISHLLAQLDPEENTDFRRMLVLLEKIADGVDPEGTRTALRTIREALNGKLKELDFVTRRLWNLFSRIKDNEELHEYAKGLVDSNIQGAIDSLLLELTDLAERIEVQAQRAHQLSQEAGKTDVEDDATTLLEIAQRQLRQFPSVKRTSLEKFLQQHAVSKS